MIMAWFFATALSKHWEETIIYFEKEKLDVWVHNKTIQKARESYRIITWQKEYLKSLKKENDVSKAYDLSKNFCEEDLNKITKEGFKDEHRDKKKNC